MQEPNQMQSETLPGNLAPLKATGQQAGFDASPHNAGANPSGSPPVMDPAQDDYSRPSPPDHGTMYYPSFWGAYKGHVRGLLRGLIIGALVGAFLGGCLSLLAPLFPALLLAGVPAGAMIAALTGVGAIVGSELMGKIGNSAGNAASHFAQKELRLRYPSLPEISPDSPAPGIGHHFEIPPDKDYNKVFHKEVALPGLILGTGIGALLAFSTHGAGGHLIGETAGQLLAGGAAHGAASTTLTTGGIIGAGSLFGLSFGINRGLFKSLFNWSDSLFLGRLTGPSKEDIRRDMERYKVQDPSKPYVISGAQRYDEYQRLLNGYFKKSFSAGWSGDRRGFLGGIFAGTLSGLAAGLLAAGVLTMLSFTAYIPVVVAICAALGGRLGMSIFSDAGREPAALTSAADIYDERIKALKNGLDITFDEAERLAAERRTHHPDMNPPGSEKSGWFSLKTGMVGLGAGALVGVVLAPFTAFGLGHILGIKALSSGITFAAMKTALPLTATVTGITGFTFGMGSKLMNKLHHFADKIFMGTFFPGHQVEDHISHDYPALGPDSQLLPQPKEKTKVPSVAAEPAQPMPAFINEILTRKYSDPAKPVAQDSSFALRQTQDPSPSTLVPGH